MTLRSDAREARQEFTLWLHHTRVSARLLLEPSLNRCLNLRHRLHRWLIILIGAADPVDVGFLVYRANLLVDLTEGGKFRGGIGPLVRTQQLAVREAIYKLDPKYATAKGMARKHGVREVEIVGGAGEGTRIDGSCNRTPETRVLGVLAEGSGS